MRYLRICPRGFANEYSTYAVPEADVSEAEEVIASRAASSPDWHAEWLDNPDGLTAYNAIPWSDMQSLLGTGDYAV